MAFEAEINTRITFAIVSHPDAGKTTVTEKLLLYGGAINMAGTVKGRKASRHATSDWMELEKQRGISVTTSVMQFPYQKKIFNLLDTPGHEDFSEDTYRTLTAVDTALMVIDCAKGVEERTIKLMDVCRLRTTPIFTFINKIDREGLDAIELLDEVERVLNIRCAPITWPVGMGSTFRGMYHLLEDKIYLYDSKKGSEKNSVEILEGWQNPLLKEKIGYIADEFYESLELVKAASHSFEREAFLKGELTPVYFGSALHNFGIENLLQGLVEFAPMPDGRQTESRFVAPNEEKFTGFVFKIQANMDPQHRDRVAFLRVCSGRFTKGMKIFQVRPKKQVNINNALTFMAGDRAHLEEAYAGDIIGLYNHGTIQIGDSFTEGEHLNFIGIPNFAPELFKAVRPKDPLKMKALLKGLTQLSEEGATQVFKPLTRNNIVLGAVGVLQFDVVAHRLQYEYNVECIFDEVNVSIARWVFCNDLKKMKEFEEKLADNLALDGAGRWVYLAPNRVNLQLTQDRWPAVEFLNTQEHRFASL